MNASKARSSRQALMALVILLGLYGLSVGYFSYPKVVREITPEEFTYTAISETFYRVHLFAKEHGALPKSLDDLPQLANHLNRTTDNWGRPLQFVIDDNGTVTIGSYGRDGLPGGAGENKDLAETLRYRDIKGRFLAADDLWVVEHVVSRE